MERIDPQISSLTSVRNSPSSAANDNRNEQDEYFNFNYHSTNERLTLSPVPANEVQNEGPPLHMILVPKYDSSILPKRQYGVIGYGDMGTNIVNKILSTENTIFLFNNNDTEIQYVNSGTTMVESSLKVLEYSDITFSCVPDVKVVRKNLWGGMLSELLVGKGYVEMSSIDPRSSEDISEAIHSRGGRYLEAMIQETVDGNAIEKSLILVAAGNKTLYEDCRPIFDAIANKSFYLGDVGKATKMNLLLNSIKAVTFTGLAEGLALANSAGLSKTDVLEFIGQSSLKCPLIVEKGKDIIEHNKAKVKQVLDSMQKDINMSLCWANSLEQPCPIISSTHEQIKRAIALGENHCDISAFFINPTF